MKKSSNTLFNACLWLLLLSVMRPTDVAAEPATGDDTLEGRVSATLRDNRVPGAVVVLVSNDAGEWAQGFGSADVERHVPVDTRTLFRVGSISKMFVSLSILKLEAEGRLHRDAPISSLVPDVTFENPWESSDPVRVVHLLEHTSGWPDLRLRDFASNDATGWSLAQGLQLSAEVRRSRWRPGSRFSYSNMGPAVAGRIIETVSGHSFEDYVHTRFFAPLGMTTATFMQPDHAAATQLYRTDGTTPYPYHHILLRPPGALNASAVDMGRFLRFLLERGSVDGMVIVTPEVIRIMETAESSEAAKAGVTALYAKGNRSWTDAGFTWHGHQGQLDGAYSDLGYVPELKAGYFIAVNGGEAARATVVLGRELRRHLVKGALVPPASKPAIAAAPLDPAFSGWYQDASPQVRELHFLSRLILLNKISVQGNTVYVSSLLGARAPLLRIGDRLFRIPFSPATVSLVEAPEGKLMLFNARSFVKVPTAMVYLQLAALIAVALAALSTAVFALVWLPRLMFGKLRSSGPLSVRALPFAAVISLAAMGVAVRLASEDFVGKLGVVSGYSVTLFLSTLCLGITSIGGVIAAVMARRSAMNRGAYWHSLLAAVAMTAVSAYFLYWGMIGYRSWN